MFKILALTSVLVLSTIACQPNSVACTVSLGGSVTCNYSGQVFTAQMPQRSKDELSLTPVAGLEAEAPVHDIDCRYYVKDKRIACLRHSTGDATQFYPATNTTDTQ